MKLSKTRTLLLLMGLGGLILAIAWLAALPPPVRVTFLYFTNSVTVDGTLRMRVFRLENHLDEPVAVEGYYQGQAEGGVGPRRGNYEVFLPWTVQEIPGGASNTFQVYFPTDGGPYRLVIGCLPKSKRRLSPWQLRWFDWKSRLPLPGNAHRISPGSFYIKSEYFKAELEDEPLIPTVSR